MYKVFKPKGNLSNITVTNEETGSSVILGRFNIIHRRILDDVKLTIPDSRDEWNFEVNEETGKALAMSCFGGYRPARIKKDEPVKTEQKEPEVKIKPKSNALDFLLGYTDELNA